MAKSSKIYFGLINCTFLLVQSCHYIYSVVIYLAKSDINKSINNEDCSDFDKFLSQQQDQLYSYTIVRLPGCVLEDFFIFPTGKFLTHHDVVLQHI